MVHLRAGARNTHPVSAILAQAAAVRAVALSADGKTRLTGSREKGVRLWDATTNNQLGQLVTFSQEEKGTGTWVIFSRDARTVLTTSDDKARVWDGLTGKQCGPTLQHQGRIDGAGISPDGKTALTA